MEYTSILIITHGKFGKEALASAEMIVGKQEDCKAISIKVDDNTKDIYSKLEETVRYMEMKGNVLILTDIVGGTPSNLSLKIAEDNSNIHVLAGFNLPVLLELLMNRNKGVGEIVELLKDTYFKSFVDLTQMLKDVKEEEDGDQIL